MSESFDFPWKNQIKRDYKAIGAYTGRGNNNTKLFTPFKLRDVVFKNRISVSPMCQYSSEDGFFSDWHLVHLGSYARGGAALVMTEATAVSPEGRITPNDTGIWKDEHIPTLKRIVDFIHSQGGLAGIQLAHAGRKASTNPPFFNTHEVIANEQNGGWTAVAPSPLKFTESYPLPRELSISEIHQLVKDFGTAAVRANKAGFDVVEIHGAHGYLINEFLSSTSNKRTDAYGGSFENRARFCLEVVKETRANWPENKPLFIRLSCHEWVEDGFNIEQCVELVKLIKNLGADLVDCSSGGNSHSQKIAVGPGYQVPFADRIRKETGMSTSAVGLITESKQADEILKKEQADLITIARQFLRDPNFPLHAASELGVDVHWPVQYERSK